MKEKIKEAQEKEENDQSGEQMYCVRGPPWNWFIKRIPKRTLKETQKTRLNKKKRKYQESTLKEYEQKYNFKNNCSPVANQMTKQRTEVIQGVAAVDDLDI